MHCNCEGSYLCGVSTCLSGFLLPPFSVPTWYLGTWVLINSACWLWLISGWGCSPPSQVYGHLSVRCICLSSPWHNSGLIQNFRSSAYLHLILWASFERENVIGLAQTLGWFLLGQVSTQVSVSCGQSVGSYVTNMGPQTHPSAEIVDGIWTALHKRFS